MGDVRLRTVLVLAALFALAPGAAPAEATAPPVLERLSDEFRETRWAHAAATTVVRRAPYPSARRVGRLRATTEDGRPEVYLALRSYRDGYERVWIEVRLPKRPNGTTGWVRRESLSRLRIVRTHLRVDRRRLRATLYRNGRPVFRARIGVGKRATPTPAGRFWIRERLDGYALGTIYGPVAFGTAAYSRLTEWPGGGVIGIHGTNRPGLLPGRVSHGCIRMRNGDIRRLARLMPIGTPVRIT